MTTELFERQTLGTIALDSDNMKIGTSRLSPAVFKNSVRGTLLGVLASLTEYDRSVFMAKLQAKFPAELQLAQHVEEWEHCQQSAQFGSDVDQACSMLLDIAAARSVALAARQVTALEHGVLSDPRGFCGQAEALFEEARTRFETTVDGTTAQDLAMEYSEVLKRRAQERLDRGEYPTTGVPALDELVVGFKPGKLYVVAAETSMGKSAFALHVLKRCETSGHSMMFSTEMGDEELMDRLIACKARVDSRTLEGARMLPDESARVVDAQSDVHDMNFTLYGARLMTIETIRAKCQIAFLKHKRLGCIVLDYLSALNTTAKFGSDNIRKKVDYIVAIAKDMAVKFRCPVILAAQLNRLADAKDGSKERPRITMLKESSGIEQEADMVIMIYRKSRNATRCEMIVGKNRSGPTGTAVCTFTPRFSSFDEYDGKEPEQQNEKPRLN